MTAQPHTSLTCSTTIFISFHTNPVSPFSFLSSPLQHPSTSCSSQPVRPTCSPPTKQPTFLASSSHFWCFGPSVLQPTPTVPSYLQEFQSTTDILFLGVHRRTSTGAHHKSQKPTGIYLSFPTISAPNLRGDLADRSSSRHLSTGLQPTAHTVPLFACGVLTPVLTLRQYSLQVVDTLAVTTCGSKRLILVDEGELAVSKAKGPPPFLETRLERPPF